MGVFDGVVQTPLAVDDPRTDWKLPVPGSLEYGSIIQDVALSGTNGKDAALIHGDKWQQLVGTHTENTLVDHKLTITGNRQEMVVGNHRHTIVGTTTATHTGVHHHTNISPRTDTFVHKRLENHSEAELEQQPTKRLESCKTETKELEEEKHIKAREWTITGLKTEATIINAEAKTTSAGVVGIGADAFGSQHLSHAFEEKLQGAVTHVMGMVHHLAPGYTDLIGLDLNAGVKVDGDSPGG